MSKSGPGRGRSWLNLKSNNPPVGETVALPPVDLQEELHFGDATEQTDLVNRIKQLNVQDDGILLNQKLKYIMEGWWQSCQSEEEVEQAFDTLFQSCLNDSDLASKLVIMVTSSSFKTKKIHKTNIHHSFLRNLQKNFESSKSLRKTNKTAFRNSVRLLGVYYHRSRVDNGLRYLFLVAPLMSYLEMLLEDAQLQDLQLFTAQLYLNGAVVKSKEPEKFMELLNSLRLLLVSDKIQSKEMKLWLLLALEVANNRFGLLPSEINKFYKDQLGDTAIASLQMIPSTLCVQTLQENKTLDDYQSNVSVLKLSSPIETSEEHFVGAEVNAVVQNCNHKEGNTKGKHGRPILGAGARLGKMKSESLDDADSKKESKRSDRDVSSIWSNKPKNNTRYEDQGKMVTWQDGKMNVTSMDNHGWNGSNVNKGWEHDDRFENNYS